MSEIGKHKLSDALPHEKLGSAKDEGGKPVPTRDMTAEQVRKPGRARRPATQRHPIASG